jgi:hypothetical protein
MDGLKTGGAAHVGCKWEPFVKRSRGSYRSDIGVAVRHAFGSPGMLSSATAATLAV